MKTIKSYWGLLILLLLVPPMIQAQEETKEEFLFAVIEFHQTKTGGIDVKVIAAEVIPKKLKSPSKSQPHLKNAAEYITVQITNDAGAIMDEIFVQDPFTGHFEYSDEEGNLAHTEVALQSSTLGLRRKLGAKASHLNIYQKSRSRSNEITSFKFR